MKKIFFILVLILLVGCSVDEFTEQGQKITKNVQEVGQDVTSGTKEVLNNAQRECCYPVECPEAENNPDDCTCIYTVTCEE